MISYLSIKNLSVIDNVEIEFGDGLNVITGETGAGKSVFVSGIKLLLGERFSKEMLRHPDEKLFVEGVFAGNFVISDELKERYLIDDEIVIRREIDPSGKNKIYINGTLSPVAELKRLGNSLADIHGQHEHQKLLNPATHIDFIDGLLSQELKDAYTGSYQELMIKIKQIKKLSSDLAATEEKREIYEFQVREIDEMRPDVETDSRIDDEISLLKNVEKIDEACITSLSNISESDINASELIRACIRALSGVSDYSAKLKDVLDTLEETSYRLDDCVLELKSLYGKMDREGGNLNALVERKFKLQELFRKHKCANVADLIDRRAELADKLGQISLADDSLASLEAERQELYNDALLAASKLNSARKEAATTIKARLEETLLDLELKGAVFETHFTDLAELDANGGITAEFYLSVNEGFEPAPMSKTASGGEISRVMLALKDIFCENDSIDTMIFDEIDTGVSGKTAKKVADKLCKIGKKKQIMAITHLPIVASKGAKHLHIEKQERDGHTSTTVKDLDGDARKNIIAMMISGDLSRSSLLKAEELLENL